MRKIICDMCKNEIPENEQHGSCTILVKDPRVINSSQDSVHYDDLCEKCMTAIYSKAIVRSNLVPITRSSGSDNCGYC